MVRSVQGLIDAGLIHVGMLEQSQANLGLQNGQNGIVDLLHRNVLVLDFIGQIFQISAAGHIHIESCGKGSVGSILPVAGVAVRDQAMNGKRVADHEAFKAPRLAQYVMQQPAVSARGHVVQIHVGAHHGSRSCVEGRLERRQIQVPHQFFWYVRRVVIAPAIRRPVAGEVLHGGQYPIGRAEFRALETENLRSCHRCTQIWILTCAFHHAAPAGIARDVDHGGEGPLNADRAGIPGSHRLCGLDHFRIP